MEFVLLFILVIVWARLLRANHDLRETRWKLRRTRHEKRELDEAEEKARMRPYG